VGVVIASTLLLLLGTVSTAAGATRFGAKLDGTRQPSNAESGWWCDDNDEALPNPTCTWVSTEAFGRPNGGFKAPRDGTIDKVRVVSCFPDSFRIQIARAKPADEKARVLRNGPTVSFQGDPDECQDDDIFKVSVVNVPNFHINKGEVIAFKDKETGALYCSGGGTVLTFHPPLVAGGSFQTSDESESCFLLVEYQYTN
jgi:hypothetical protein